MVAFFKVSPEIRRMNRLIVMKGKQVASPLREKQARGVLAPPAGLTRGSAWAVTGISILAAAALRFVVTEPLSQALDRWFGKTETTAMLPETVTAPAPATAPTSNTEVATPRKPTWSLLQLGDAVQGSIPKIQSLIAEGRAETPDFAAMDSEDKAKADRAKRQWLAWGRIWLNRVAVVEKTMPPADACSVHAAMEPACLSLRDVLAILKSVADAEGIDDALETLDSAAETLDLFLNPPEPEPLPEDEESETAEAEDQP